MYFNNFLLILLFISTNVYSKEIKKCIYINSYHQGYDWSDEIGKEIKNVLKDSCEIIQFDLDSKRNKEIIDIEKKALEAKQLIENTKPDIVITSDDNAAKYLIKPYFKNHKIPFVFCGINWTVEEYEFPYKNVTGIIEITPILNLYKLAINLSKGNKALFLGDDTITDKKDLSKFEEYAKKQNIILDHALVNTVQEWKDNLLKAQEYDFIILGHNSAIKDWDDEEIKAFILKNNKKLIMTTYSWMMPFSMIGLIIKAEEQGNWAATTAKAILDGYKIDNISISTNKTWNNFLNMKLINGTDIKIPREILIKSKKFEMD